MNKGQALQKLFSFGDSVIDFRGMSRESIVVTNDLKEKYIVKRLRNKPYIRDRRFITVWSWTDDNIINIDANDIYKITPLSSILNNEVSN